MNLHPLHIKIAAFLYCLLCSWQISTATCTLKPVGLIATNQTNHTVRFFWNELNSATEWDILIIPLNSTDTTFLTVSTRPYYYNLLEPNTTYRFQVRSRCSSSSFSPWSSPRVFTTALNNPSACHLNIVIPDSDTTYREFPIDVVNAPGSHLGRDVLLKEVRIVFRHDWDSDLDFYLRSPSGIRVDLSTDNGGSHSNFGDPDDTTCLTVTRFVSTATADYCAANPVSLAEAPFIGAFIPEGNLDAFNDNSNPNNLWSIGIRDDAGGNIGALEYVELVFVNGCQRPTTPELLNVTSSSALLNWTPGTPCTETIVEYGPAGFTPGTGQNPGPGGTVVVLTCPVTLPYTLNGLQHEQSYDVYIREKCINGLFSENTCRLTLMTFCSPPPATISDTFDGQTDCSTDCGASCPVNGLWHNLTGDQLDWFVHSGPAPSWPLTGPSEDVTGTGSYLYLETSGCTPHSVARLESDCVMVQADTGDCHMSFFYLMHGATVDSLWLEISSDGGEYWQPIWALSGEQGTLWKRIFIDLTPFNQQTIQFRFSASNGAGNLGDIAIDQIEFYGSQPSGAPLVYYLDSDGDGYGDAAFTIRSCLSTPPSGYSDNALDCNDAAADIHPNTDELFCNQIDENCNGMADDGQLPDPFPVDVSVCKGTAAELALTSDAIGQYYWFDAAGGGLPLGTGNHFTSPLLTENTDYYVMDSLSNGLFTCFSHRVRVHVTVLPVPEFTAASVPVFCSGTAFNLQTVEIQGDNLLGASLSYHTALPTGISNAINPQIVPNVSGSYYIQATSPDGCSGVAAVQINLWNSPNAYIQQGDTMNLCAGENTVLHAISINGGTPPFSFQWNTGSVNSAVPIFGNYPAGTQKDYSVTITDAKGCSSADSTRINYLSSIDAVAVSITPVTICNGSNGSIQGFVTGGVPPYQIAWSGALSGNMSASGAQFDIGALVQGTYNITITDNSVLACPFIIPFQIVNGPVATIKLDSIQSPSCFGGINGAIFTTISGNNPQIHWSNNADTPDISGIAAGLYSITVTDGQCSNVLGNIVVSQPDALFAFVESIGKASCTGSDNANIQMNVAGGTPPYAFQWSNGSQSEDNYGLAPGQYVLSIQDSKGCTFTTDSIPVSDPEPLTASMETGSPTCFESQDGYIDLRIFGGRPPFTYHWNNSASTEDLTGLPAGTYLVTVNDANGCTQTDSILLQAPDSLAIQTFNVSQASCTGINDGAISVEISGGTEPYTFHWNNDSTDETITSLVPGAYQFSVLDAHGCSLVSPQMIIQAPEVMNLSLNYINDAFCFGMYNGEVNIQVSGGTEPYHFHWSNDMSSEDLTQLGEGDYYVTVTDANGCISTSEAYHVKAPQLMDANVDQLDPIHCAGESNGRIYITVSGGVDPYFYQWSNNAQTEDITGLSAGNYSLTATDNLGCQFIQTYTITSPDTLSTQINAVDPLICYGDNNGGIDLQINGGTAPYSVSWNNGLHTEDLSGITAGTYWAIVIDAHNCVSASPIIEIEQPAPLQVSVETVGQISCDGNNGGSIELQVNGGEEPYSFLWNTGDTTQVISDIPGGEYSVVISDHLGCSRLIESIKVVEVTQPLTVGYFEITQPLNCYGNSEATLEVQLQGGTPPFQYNWSAGNAYTSNAYTETVTGLEQGYYSVTITDNRGCVVSTDTLHVVQPDLLQVVVDSIHTPLCNGDGGAFILVSAVGGTEPYHYHWNNNAVVDDLYDIQPGNYTLTVTDNHLCETILPVQNIPQPPAALQIDQAMIEAVKCYGDPEGSISLHVSGGMMPYHFLWINDDTTATITGVTTGFYNCTITDVNGCYLYSPAYYVPQPSEQLFIDTPQITSNLCPLGNQGAIDLSVYGGTPPYIFHWSNGAFTEDLSGIPGGSYRLTVTDHNDCEIMTDLLGVFEPSPFTLDKSATKVTPGQQNGTATVIAGGASPPYDYLWDDAAGGQQTSTATGLSPGWYVFTVTDHNGCTAVDSVEVMLGTGTFDPYNGEQIRLYPNPASDLVYLAFNFPQPSSGQLLLYNALGQQVLWQELDRVKDQTILLQLEAQPAGVYWLVVRTGEGYQRAFTVLLRK